MSAENNLKYWNEIKEGDVLDPIILPVPFEKVILNAAATQDFFPGHHNPDYAKQQGQKNIYLNTMAIQGIIDRVASDWLGPHVFIRKRTMKIQNSIYAGDILHGAGVVEKCKEENGRYLMNISITLSTNKAICVPALLTVEVPFSKKVLK